MEKAKSRKSGGLTAPASRRPSFQFQVDGYSIIELMLVLLLISALTGIAMDLTLGAHKSLQRTLSSSTLLADGLTALNQMTRDIRMAGFPSSKCFTAAAVSTSPGLVANGFVAASSYDLKFEADVNGSGQVSQIEYVIPSGSQTLYRYSTLKNLDGTLATGTTVSTAFLGNVQNQVLSTPLFSWDLDPLSSNSFPQNIKTVYINLVLTSSGNESGMPVNVTLTATCQRVNP